MDHESEFWCDLSDWDELQRPREVRTRFVCGVLNRQVYMSFLEAYDMEGQKILVSPKWQRWAEQQAFLQWREEQS